MVFSENFICLRNRKTAPAKWVRFRVQLSFPPTDSLPSRYLPFMGPYAREVVRFLANQDIRAEAPRRDDEIQFRVSERRIRFRAGRLLPAPAGMKSMNI